MKRTNGLPKENEGGVLGSDALALLPSNVTAGALSWDYADGSPMGVGARHSDTEHPDEEQVLAIQRGEPKVGRSPSGQTTLVRKFRLLAKAGRMGEARLDAARYLKSYPSGFAPSEALALQAEEQPHEAVQVQSAGEGAEP